MQLDLTIDDIANIVKKQLNKYKKLEEIEIDIDDNFIFILFNRTRYIIYFNINNKYIKYSYNSVIYFYFYEDINEFIGQFSNYMYEYEHFNNNKKIILNEICRYITNDIITDIKVYKIRIKSCENRDIHEANLKNIEQYCRTEKLKYIKCLN